MANLIPAIEGEMGSTRYWSSTLKASELARIARAASERDDWANMGIEDRMQRELDHKRIDREIIPYLVNAADRFFASLIILVYDPDVFEFESMDELGGDSLPTAYGAALKEKMGVLSIDSGEMVALDGQHRLVSLRKIIQEDESVQAIKNGRHVAQVPGDDISVMFVLHEEMEKTRRIFNKVNRQAKKTSKSDNIITSEDDGYAIVTRRLMRVREDQPFGIEDENGDLIVDWRSNSITKRSKKFTTMSCIYESVQDILEHLEPGHFEDFEESADPTRPDEDDLDRAHDISADWWAAVLDGIEPYREAISDLQDGNNTLPERRDDRSAQYSLIFKPAGQNALMKGLLKAYKRADDQGVNLSRADLIERVHDVDFRIEADLWVDILVLQSGRMSSRKRGKRLGGELIAYMIAPEAMDDSEIEELYRSYNEERGNDLESNNPEEEEMPEDLPAPVEAEGQVPDQFL
ncbi:DGQHR domain-containing protein [Salinibacter ruber]|uniref:DGQHR domain-containing protein n=1 Tax=Salinibacter ruber TaxID=146919 RepID=UPI00207312C6|nr:DGQHR domain-containing protein [Salinibacter ruber]